MRFRSWLIMMCCFAGGCGSSGPFDYVPVSGTVTYEDGTPLPSGLRLVFTAQDTQAVGTAHPRPAIANVDDQGVFDCVTSHKYGDGLIPGRHKVVVQAAGGEGRPMVPKEYTRVESTPLEIDTADAPLHIKVPKP